MDQKRRWMKELKRMMLDHYTVKVPEKTKELLLNMDDGFIKSTSVLINHGTQCDSYIKLYSQLKALQSCCLHF